MISISYYYNIYDILKVKSNYPILPNYLLVKSFKHPDLEFEKRSVQIDKRLFGEHFLTETLEEKFYGGKNKLYLEQRFKWFLISKALLENLHNKTKFIFEFKKPKFIFSLLPGTIFNIENIKEHLIQIKLLQKGHTLIHAGVIVENKNGYLIAGWSNVGKSTTTHYLSKYGFEILSDSTPILSKRGEIFSLGEYGEYILNNKKIFFQYNTTKARAKKLFFLVKSPVSNIIYVEPEKLTIKLIVSLQKAIETVLSRRIFLAYSLLNDYFIDEVEEMKKILSSFLKKIECYIVYGNRNNFYKNILKFI